MEKHFQFFLRRRLFQLDQHEIIQLDNLPFDFGAGNCVGDIGHEDKVFMCSDFFDELGCWTWDGWTHNGFKKINSTMVSHYTGGLQRFNNSVVAWSGNNDKEGTTEMFVDDKWIKVSFYSRESAKNVRINSIMWLNRF